MTTAFWKWSFLCWILCIGSVYAQKKTSSSRPNIIVILADDMGYSDIGCYGGEIPTPNIDRLAKNGIRFTQFYNTSRCCPTRASLMSGLFSHQAGIGAMSEDPESRDNGPDKNDWGTDGYRGYLSPNAVTIAEVLKQADYHTYMVGKWHLGMHEKEKQPLQRGFERYYGILSGACSYLHPSGRRTLTLDNSPIKPEGENYYTTDAFTDYAIRFVKEQKDQKPFFMYVAYNAPHWPLQAKQADIEKFVGKYMVGWDQVRKDRFTRQLQEGLMNTKWPLAQREEDVRPWNELSEQEQKDVSYRMAVYAAQVYCMDYNIGRIIQTLEEKKQLDNTVILFLSDNGACAEPYKELGGGSMEEINNPTKSGSVSYGIGWANASNTPFRKYKKQPYEGGISTPMIVHWPKGITEMKGKFCVTPSYLIDVMPSVLELTKATYPKTYNQHTIIPLEGRSFVSALKTGKTTEHPYMYWEHSDACAIRQGKWKAVKQLKDKTWELYDVEADRTEQHNLAAQHPEIVEKLNAEWYRWANSHQVLPKKAE